MAYMPRTHYFLAGMIYFCSNIIILFASICESTTYYKFAYPFPPGSAPITLAKPSRVLDLEFYHPCHLDLPSGHPRVIIPPAIKEIPTTPPPPNTPPAQDFSKLGFFYITVLGLANQVVPHTGSWCLLATAVNYLVRIVPIVYMAFQDLPASPVGVQLDSGMSHDKRHGPSSRNYSVYHPQEVDEDFYEYTVGVFHGKVSNEHRHRFWDEKGAHA
ncbi:hypothetical protein DSO57_1000387 [Entomophthora muscae]|uniref:Uncharacterized protein n=1 Tax=Entomophthora muscae TaxID=34485 RepID=A0ACC2UJE5_9FUNG|nr:hypothetical protein DSO57_1000387 [Entomophthora muscae]